ncbi:unnamed protein product [Paramecium sonneborni]|uniref:Uncharacterized protein n=1 Tax=Paramecium sonneborni TaxID=65129 RepID=A0A8S1PMU5_9CILI|nr:unnamed protein product [Paramecium sonneborni]
MEKSIQYKCYQKHYQQVTSKLHNQQGEAHYSINHLHLKRLVGVVTHEIR